MTGKFLSSEVQGDCRFLPPGSRLELVDHSMISRLTRSMSVLSPQGQDIPLRDLFPSPRDVHKRLIGAILDERRSSSGAVRQGLLTAAGRSKPSSTRRRSRSGGVRQEPALSLTKGLLTAAGRGSVGDLRPT